MFEEGSYFLENANRTLFKESKKKLCIKIDVSNMINSVIFSFSKKYFLLLIP